MHAKYYNPTLGRFLSVDPMGGEVGSSQGWNRYSYVENRPLMLVDPDGRMTDAAAEYMAGYNRPKVLVGASTPVQKSIAAACLYPMVATMALGGAAAAIELAPAFLELATWVALNPKTSQTVITVAEVANPNPGTLNVGASVNPKIYLQLEKQLERDGASSIHKALRSAQKTLQEHKDKVESLELKSQVEGTIKNVERQIETLEQFIKDKEL
jgi:uncharacterized protein RhaS with RHS repeats